VRAPGHPVGSADSGGAPSGLGIGWGPTAVQVASLNPVVLTVSSRPHRAGGAGWVVSSGPVDRRPDSFRQAYSVKAMCSVPQQLHFQLKLQVGFPRPVRTPLPAHSSQLLLLYLSSLIALFDPPRRIIYARREPCTRIAKRAHVEGKRALGMVSE